MNGDIHPEDLAILASVTALEGGREPLAGGPRGDETAETLARLYAEVLGLIPFGLDAVAPPPEVRSRLMASIRGDETQDLREPAPPTDPEPIRLASLPSPPASPTTIATEGIPTPLAIPRPVLPRTEPAVTERSTPPRATPAPAAPPRSATVSQEMRAVRPSLTPPPRPPRPARWPLALAATLALAFAGLSAWLWLEMGAQQRTIASLENQLGRESQRAEIAVTAARRAQADALSMQEKMALVTAPASLASPLRPAGAAPLQPAARGVLFVAADHQHWYLRLHGVEPAPPGKAYKLWFVSDQGPVSGGEFSARPGTPVELSSKQMPTGTKAVMVTLEDDPRAAVPAGPEVLRAAGAMIPLS